MKKILIIEDDNEIAFIEKEYLKLNGYDAEICDNGLDGMSEAMKNPYDLILLDLMLPGLDGFTVCKNLREHLDIPILLVTAMQEDVDKIRGLGVGGDDYIVKPFSPAVLVARVKSHLAQYERLKNEGESTAEKIEKGDICLLATSRTVTSCGKEVLLTNREYELLYFLMKHADKLFSREDLYEYIWGLNSMGDNITVAVHINRLRDKLEADPSNPVHIKTVRRVGYMFKS